MEHKQEAGQHKQKGELSIKTETDSTDAETWGIRGEPMSIRKQPCRMEVDGDMELGSIE